MRKLVLLGALFAFNVAAANDDDGFVWVDANTKIKVKPIGSAATGGTKAPEPAKREKQEKPKK